METSLGQPLESTPQEDIIEVGESASRLVAMIDSLLPILDSESDGCESSGSCDSSFEVFMANTEDRAASRDNRTLLGTLIADQTAGGLEQTRQLMPEEQARLVEQ